MQAVKAGPCLAVAHPQARAAPPAAMKSDPQHASYSLVPAKVGFQQRSKQVGYVCKGQADSWCLETSGGSSGRDRGVIVNSSAVNNLTSSPKYYNSSRSNHIVKSSSSSSSSSSSKTWSAGSRARRILLGGMVLIPAFQGANTGQASALEAGPVALEEGDAEGAMQLTALKRGPPSPGSLEQRVLTAGDVTKPGNSLFSKPGVILYPKWMFGEWKVTSRLQDFRIPLGPQFVDPGLVQSAQMELQQGEPLQYSMRFFSTLPDTLGNQVKFNLGIMPTDAIADDRAYNTMSLANATAGWDAVSSVSYDPTNAPDRETVEFSRLSPDMQPLPPRRAELYIGSTRSESPVPSIFVTSQLYRQVMLGVRSAETSDYEVMTIYEAFPGGVILARQRTAIYLQPYDPGYFKAFGRAVAIYDHVLEMKRVPAPADAPGADACVKTPKADYVQCL